MQVIAIRLGFLSDDLSLSKLQTIKICSLFAMSQSTESNVSSSKSQTSKNSGKSSLCLQNRVSLLKEYGGLGQRYYDRLGQNLDKILQVKCIFSVAYRL